MTSLWADDWTMMVGSHTSTGNTPGDPGTLYFERQLGGVATQHPKAAVTAGSKVSVPGRYDTRTMLSRADNPLVRAVARVPTTLRRKLLVAFAAIVVPLVVGSALSVRVLGDSNKRVEELGIQQQRAATYRALENDTTNLRQLLDSRAADRLFYDSAIYRRLVAERIRAGGSEAVPGVETYVGTDLRVQSTLQQDGRKLDHLGFTPTGNETQILLQIQADYERLNGVMNVILEHDFAGQTSEGDRLQTRDADPITSDLEQNLAGQLAKRANADTINLIEQNRSAYADSQHLVIAIAGVSIALALLLGFVLSRSIVGPIRRVNTRFAEIATGDFSGHVEVANRDELGILAANLNRMNAELGRVYRDLESASRHKTEFLANMSHELRTPLNAIIGFSEVLLERMFGPVNERQADYLEDILSSGRHLLALINDILDVSRIEAGKMELQLSRFSLPAALENGITMVRERAAGHGISLHLEVGPGVSTIEADEVKVKQVVFNLLANAVKFTPNGGRVDVVARALDGTVEVAVRDTGIGIAASDQERIFEEFQQAGQREGSGLGLAVARSLVVLHGGDLQVASQPGAGSTFTFTLPVRQPAPAGTVGEDPAGNGSDAALQPAGATVLVIEDDEHSIELLTLYLEGAGFTTVACRNGEDGIEAARRLRPVAIILDIVLPGLDGWEFLTAIKADAATAAIPVIIVSMLDDRGKGFALGAADYLVKPVSREGLLSTLRPLAVSGGSFKVLAIDDDPVALELIEAVLGTEGFIVLRARGGDEGVELARRELPSLVILDLLMPEVDGFTVVEQLRADPATAAIPIVILTAKAVSPEDRARLTSRVSHLAAKGQFSRDEFVEMVRRFSRVPVA